MADDQAAIFGEVEAAYRHYVEVFNRRDPNEIAELYHRPHAQVIDEIGLSIVTDDADQQQWYELVMAYLDDQGWGRTEIDELWIWPLTQSVAQLVSPVTRYRIDGSVLQHARANYTLCRRNGSWKVVLSFPSSRGRLQRANFAGSFRLIIRLTQLYKHRPNPAVGDR